MAYPHPLGEREVAVVVELVVPAFHNDKHVIYPNACTPVNS